MIIKIMQTIKKNLTTDIISQETLLWGLVALAFLFSLFVFSIGWHHPIVDQHAFRQTQTAISSFWMLKEGSYLIYQTPVLGYPWSVPMEFPLYQWLVVAAYKLTHLKLDQSGRLVSILAFYLTLLPVYFLLKELDFKKTAFKIFTCLFLLSPFYLFWARTFMIESLGLLLVISFLALTQTYLNKPKVLTAIFIITFGCFGALTKITTFVPAALFCIGLCLMDWQKKYGYTISKKIIRHYEICALFVLIPLMMALFWTGYTDCIKAIHPIGHFLTAKALMTWNFGTMAQRLSPYLWILVIFERSFLIESLGYCIPFLILFIYWHTRKKYLPGTNDKVNLGFALICVAIYFSVFLIFTNLYIEHNYYRYANTIYLILAAAVVLYIIHQKISHLFFTTLLLVIMAMQIRTYGFTYMESAKIDGTYFNRDYQIASFVRKHTKPDDFIVVHGIDYASTIAYYSERKSLTHNFATMDEYAKKLQNIDKCSGGLQLGAIVLCPVGKPPVFDNKTKKLLKQLNRGYSSVSIANCLVFYEPKTQKKHQVIKISSSFSG
jgi:hypothetical protein